ncbi:hypothetical protein G6F55_007429 [Rhizopus delemar]|uniref:GATA-type domain-containing protein n=2 Tax=Rhizopus TaxID=4842 RepID=A0A9P6YYV9_9FUNG|nr:hypothetical protein G6F55_007429 [Rhizopus delemar]KAG1549475.1 hypothetical protein G6F51_003038 [Rhizopus arrhizus]KAG1523816.1 hypothetical protein G6F52_004707 [Rhizopus delemar]KAG1559673.1 hypothetical protein G6F49_003388 [Rhizopus delemar]KAG1567289.1 hypothetical protein G6F50_008348 [Rhizopus delemar]
MAPLSFVIKGDKTFSPFSTFESEQDLCQSWKACAKIKNLLDHGPRLENLSWRLWFREQKKQTNFRALSSKTTRKLSINDSTVDLPIQYYERQGQEGPMLTDYAYLPPAFTTTDQAIMDPVFHTFPDMDDGWDFGYPSPTNAYSPPTTANMLYDNTMINTTDSNALYVANTSMPPPPPTSTLHNKLLGQQSPFGHQESPLSVEDTSGYSMSAPSSPQDKLNKRPASSHAENKPVCTNCGATKTPLWRRSIEDDLLCNACGLYQKLHNAPRPKSLKPHNSKKELKEVEGPKLVCSNCSTIKTPLWRRDDEGAPLCNACGLYYKLHHERRPLSMKTDVIKKRQRYESSHARQARKSNHKKLKEEQQITMQSDPSFMLMDDVFPTNTMMDDVLSNYC